ncbi:MAG: class I SAM-dependent methyltransferase [Bacteroidetes bacterium]|nr:class I SAM-dependent methyltransferase [Bacteroidota bacterium]
MKCSVCGNTEFGETLSVKEMMYGKDDFFTYKSCLTCDSLIIEKIPENLASYYPNDYYSFTISRALQRFGAVKSWLIKVRDLNFYKVKSSLIGKWLIAVFPLTETEIQFKAYQFAFKQWAKNAKSKLLDVGSGNGNIVRYMQSVGFKGITGIDPFIEKDIYLDAVPVILKKDIFEWNEPVDAVMMNHSFEHMLRPKEIIEKIASILKPGGECMIRVPVRGGGFDRYKEHWLCFDAPRHLFLTTEKGIRELIKGTALEFVKVEYETPPYYAIGSELIKKGYSFTRMEDAEKLLSKEEIENAKQFTDTINKENKGDAAAYYLRKKA